MFGDNNYVANSAIQPYVKLYNSHTELSSHQAYEAILPSSLRGYFI